MGRGWGWMPPPKCYLPASAALPLLRPGRPEGSKRTPLTQSRHPEAVLFGRLGCDPAPAPLAAPSAEIGHLSR